MTIGLTGCRQAARHDNDTQPPEITVATPQIDSVTLRQPYPAQLTATRQADVVARVNGRILARHYADGQHVKAGQPLFTIESTTYRNKLQQAQAQLESAQARYEYATRQCAAMQKALEADAVSKMDVIQAESAVRESQAAVNTARAAVGEAATMAGYCTVTAPIAGKVSAALFDTGAYVGGEVSPVTLATVIDDSKLYAGFAIENSRFLALKNTQAGQGVDLDKVPVTFGDTITRTYYGPVDYDAPAVDPSTGTIAMRVAIDNSAGELRSGMFATVDLPYATDPHALLINDASIGTDQLGKYVYVVNDSDRVVYTHIETGPLYRDTLRIVTSGLSPDSRYVTQALMKVRDGMKVRPTGTGTRSVPQNRR